MVGRSVELVDRRRLVDPLRGQRLVALIAPSGFGKTVLLEQLLELDGRAAPLRVRLDAVAGPEELVDALRRAARRAGMDDLVAAMAGEDPTDALDGLLGYATGGGGFAIAVDEVQRLDARARRLARELVADLPPACRAIVAGREGDWARGWPGVHVGAADLRMTADEVARVLGPRPPRTVVEDLVAVTEGWPAAVAVAATHLRADPAWSPSSRAASRSVLAVLVDELVADDRATLARLAQLPLVDPTVAELVAGPRAHEALERSGLPVRHERGGWISIPDAIRNVLVADARFATDARTLAAVAERYASRGELSAAVRLLVAHRAHDALAAVLAARHWTELEDLGLGELGHVLELIPDDLLAADATVLVEGARAAEANHPALRDAWLQRLERLALPPTVGRAAAAERARQLVRAVRIDEALAVAKGVTAAAEPGEHVTRARALLAAAHAHAFLATEPAYDEAEAELVEAAELFDLAGEHRWQAEALARLGYSVLFHRGRPHAAMPHLEAALSLLPASDRTRAHWLAMHVDVLDTLDHPTLADAAIAEAIEIGERIRDPGVVATALWSRAWVEGRRGNAAAVRAALAQVERLAPPWLVTNSGVEFYGSIADHLVALGDVAGARRCQARARALHERLPYPEAIGMMDARIDAFVGDPAASLATLERLDRAIGAAPNTRWVRRLEAALALVRLGRADDARAAVAEALSIVDGMGVPDLPHRFERPLVELLSGVWPERVAPPPPAVEVTLLGGFAVRAGAQDLTPPAGHPSTVLQLLAVRGTMTADALIDVLWPDAAPATGRARLRNTVNRLRARSGDVVERRDDSLRLAPSVRTDLQAFEAAAAEALAAGPQRRGGLARRALALHTGELLPAAIYEDWAAAPRERVARRFLALVDVVADDAERDGNLDETARLLDLGIAADPLDDRRYARLARILLRQGRGRAAAAVARRAVGVFADLGLAPAPELVSLAAAGAPPGDDGGRDGPGVPATPRGEARFPLQR